MVFQNLLVIKNASGVLQAPWSLGGWTSNKKDKKTRVNETHLDQRLVNGLFHLLIDGVKMVKGLSAFSVQAHKFCLVKSSQCSAVPDRCSCFFGESP